MATLVIEASLYQVVDKGLLGCGVLGRALDYAQRLLQPACFDTHRSEHLHAILVAHLQAVDLDRDQIVMRKVGRHPLVVPGLRHGHDRRVTADFDGPSSGSMGISASDSLSALPNKRATTFIAIIFTAIREVWKRSTIAPRSQAGSPCLLSFRARWTGEGDLASVVFDSDTVAFSGSRVCPGHTRDALPPVRRNLLPSTIPCRISIPKPSQNFTNQSRRSP